MEETRAKADPRYVRGTVEHAKYRRDAARAKAARLEERIGELCTKRVIAEEDEADWIKEIQRLEGTVPT
jgi:hypothetical protein